jgi:hypothetical protein
VQFVIPDDWTVQEDDLDVVIRAITVDTPSEGYCMIDIYKAAQAPDLSRYIDNQLKHFVEALPLGFKVIEGPFKAEERASRHGTEVVGLAVNLVIRSLLRRRVPDSSAFYRVELGSYTALCSLRCPADAYPQLRPGFGERLESFSVQQAVTVGTQ